MSTVARPMTLREGVRLLWDEASKRPRDGLCLDNVNFLMAGMDVDDAANALWLAMNRNALLQVRRLHGEGEAEKDEWRFFAMGRRP